MYVNSGYLNNSQIDPKDQAKPLVVEGCGTYRLKDHPTLPTNLPKGRRDYQLLYVAGGKAHFWIDGQKQTVAAGHMVLYHPNEPQRYVYYAEEHPEAFWVRFTGCEVKRILQYHEIPQQEHVFYTGTLPEYRLLFRRIIGELQLCQLGYEDYTASMLNSLFLLVHRQRKEGRSAGGPLQEEIEQAVAYFNEYYNTKISVEQYARSLHISTNWFIRSFKRALGMSPTQYILSLRMVNAQSLLEHTHYNVSEIAAIVGYDNPLYFSRVFKRELGASPAQYRKSLSGAGPDAAGEPGAARIQP